MEPIGAVLLVAVLIIVLLTVANRNEKDEKRHWDDCKRNPNTKTWWPGDS